MLLLRNHSGVDFSLYKSSTIQRRIKRRIILSKHDTVDDYVRFLRGNAKELDALYSDVLISVTSFFRNPDAFDMLQREVWPALLKQRTDAPVRVWVLGCSTGQEAYSLAMSFTEAADTAPQMRALQVFATDLNETLLEKARQGLYVKSVAQDLSPERLRRFFVEEDAGYRVSKGLREKVVFARQNVISDPPFSRMDLISCRAHCRHSSDRTTEDVLGWKRRRQPLVAPTVIESLVLPARIPDCAATVLGRRRAISVEPGVLSRSSVPEVVFSRGTSAASGGKSTAARSGSRGRSRDPHSTCASRRPSSTRHAWCGHH